MITLIVTIGILIAVYFVQDKSPLMAGLMAVIPVKIVSTIMMSYEKGGGSNLERATEGILIGQVSWLLITLIFYNIYIRN